MKLFYSPGTCSLSPHIALIESGLKFDLERLDFKTMNTSLGDYKKISPKGKVPALLLDNGELLTEGAVIVQYIADHSPSKKMIAPAGSMERYRTQEWLNFVATELHKAFIPLFMKDSPEETKELARKNLTKSFSFAAEQLEKHDFLLGKEYSVADGYLFNMTVWCSRVHFDLAKWPSLMKFIERVKSRPSTQAAMKAEGLI